MENYFQKNDIGYNPEDFDFNVFGRPRKRSHPIQWDDSNSFRRRSKPQIKSERPVADLDLTRVKDVKLSREGEMINSGKMYYILNYIIVFCIIKKISSRVTLCGACTKSVNVVVHDRLS